MDFELQVQLTRTVRQMYGFCGLCWGNQLGGLSSTNIAFEADGASYVLKQYVQSARSQLGRLEAIALFLERHGFCAPSPLPNSAKKRHFLSGEFAFAVFPRFEGRVLHQGSLTSKALQSTAQVLSRLHSLGDAAKEWFSMVRPGAKHDESSIDLLEKRLDEDHCMSQWRDLVTRSLGVKRRVLAASSFQQLKAWSAASDFVHGDFHNENILYDADREVCCVLDYEASYLGHGICDAINFVQFACCNNGFDRASLAAGQQFIASYAQARRCSRVDIRLGWLSFFERMALSTFLEDRLLTGDASFAQRVQRDIANMEAFVCQGDILLDALLT